MLLPANEVTVDFINQSISIWTHCLYSKLVLPLPLEQGKPNWTRRVSLVISKIREEKKT